MAELVIPSGLLNLKENELLFLLGDELGQDTGTEVLALEGLENAIDRAKEWLNKQRDLLRSKICGHPVIQVLVDDTKLSNGRLILLLTIADVIADAKLGVSPFILSALIIQQGVRELCQ